MTTHKEALEAAYLAGFNASGEGYNGEYPFGDKMQDPAENRVWKKDRDNYIKEALAQPEQERCVGCEACIDTACGRDECPKGWPKAVQPEQEPVPAAMKTVIEAMQQDPDYAWGWHCNIAMSFVDAGGDHYTGNQGAARFMRTLANVEPAHELPFSPPQRIWVGLTDDEIRAEEFDHVRRRDFARAIEAKLKEKNT